MAIWSTYMSDSASPMDWIKARALHFLWTLSTLAPRNTRIWVFSGWHRGPRGEIFTDNCKYLYLYVSKHEPRITAIWLAKDRALATTLREHGYRAYYEKSLAGVWYALCAGVTVLDAYLSAYNYRFVGRSRIVQLLHGKGMKEGGYATKPLRPNDYIFAPSSFVLEILSEAFSRGSKKCITGYPRSDALLGCDYDVPIHTDEETVKILTTLRAQGTKCVWYAPTFRRGEHHFAIHEKIDMPRMSQVLAEANAHLFISLHPKYHRQTLDSQYDNIHVLREQNFFPLYPLFDILITDYSSSFTDFLLLDRPIIFYPYDLEAYQTNEGISIDYENMTPGTKAYTKGELIEVLKTTLATDTYGAARARIRKQYHTYADNRASKRITDILVRDLDIR